MICRARGHDGLASFTDPRVGRTEAALESGVDCKGNYGADRLVPPGNAVR
ncbi:hypothetical protein KNP414_03053 [Paenibacillus mucilaginosus KNP414]|uniref:Uncharacterized protein n=1 Tax=Paenibacillus mucilaginosus (strain KNP414) TaxID=1036673 RepID=F8F8M3_PAEMK|nr:hypothetical protein KNP414_03053 [Paenibacillus mucilaginosus KNP414]